MTKVLIPLAQGCEELEAVTVIDLLRRANFTVVTAGLDAAPVRASRGVVLIPDTDLDTALRDEYDMVVLPGGLPGSDHLNDDPRVRDLVTHMASQGKRVAAICAAPKVLASTGVLSGKQATGYPGVLSGMNLPDVEITGAPVTVDGNIITSRGPGTAMDFALELIEHAEGRATRDEVEAALVRP